MEQRIGLLKREIKRMRRLAQACDDDVLQQFMDVAEQMERLVKQIEERVRSASRTRR